MDTTEGDGLKTVRKMTLDAVDGHKDVEMLSVSEQLKSERSLSITELDQIAKLKDSVGDEFTAVKYVSELMNRVAGKY